MIVSKLMTMAQVNTNTMHTWLVYYFICNFITLFTDNFWLDSNIGPVDHSGNCGSINVNKDKGKKILVENQRDNDTESDDIARNVIFYDSEEEDMVMKDLWLVDMDLWLVMMDLCL